MSTIEQLIQDKAYELGYEKCGIVSIAALSGFKDKFEDARFGKQSVVVVNIKDRHGKTLLDYAAEQCENDLVISHTRPYRGGHSPCGIVPNRWNGHS